MRCQRNTFPYFCRKWYLKMHLTVCSLRLTNELIWLYPPRVPPPATLPLLLHPLPLCRKTSTTPAPATPPPPMLVSISSIGAHISVSTVNEPCAPHVHTNSGNSPCSGPWMRRKLITWFKLIQYRNLSHCEVGGGTHHHHPPAECTRRTNPCLPLSGDAIRWWWI